jgi:hypothetical protein
MMDEAEQDRLRERAHAIWEREGRPEGGHERHWAMAGDELRTEASGAAPAGGAAAPSSTAGTETWTGQGASGGPGTPPAGDPADPDAPGRQPDPAGEGRHWWEKDATKHRSHREQTNMAPDDLRSNEL